MARLKIGVDMETQAALQALGNLTGGFTAFGAAAMVVSSIAEGFQNLSQQVIASVGFVEKYREAITELAALKGETGTQELASQLAFRQRTLQTQQEAIATQQAGYGAGEAFVDTADQQKLISREGFESLLTYAGKMQTVKGGDAGAYGQLAGMLPQLMGRRITGEEGMQKMAQLFAISQPGGADFAPQMEMMSKNASLITQGLYSPEEYMAMQSMFSTTKGTEAGDTMRQFTRATVGALGRMRGVAGGEEKTKQYLARILPGAAQMAPEGLAEKIGTAIAEDLDKQEAAAEAKGEEFNVKTYLQQRGYGQEEEQTAINLFRAGLKNQAWQKTFKPLAEKLPTVEDATKDIEESQRTDPKFDERRSKLAEELRETGQGVGAEGFQKNLMKMAFESLQSRPETALGAVEFKDVYDPSMLNIPGQMRYSAVAREAGRLLDVEAQKVGLTGGKGKFGRESDIDELETAEQLYQRSAKIRALGGTGLPGLDAIGKEVGNAIGKAADTEKRSKVPEALPGGGEKSGLRRN